MAKKNPAGIGRRAFVSATAVGLAGCGAAPLQRLSPPPARAADSAPEHESDGSPGATAPLFDGDAITAATIAAAEKLVAVSYTPGEREVAAASVEGQIALAVGRRSHMPPNHVGPAQQILVRAPRLPSRSVFRGSRGEVSPLPTEPADIAFAPVSALSKWIERRQLSSERLTEIYIDRLERYGPRLECVVTLMKDAALEQAREMDRELRAGRHRGPLHGIPWGAKDLFDTAGVPTTWGAAPYRDRVPDEDAHVVHRLREAGAVLVAKLSLGALAYGDLWFGGRTRNPWFVEEGSNGSSAGSAAATSAGLVAFSLGTETHGSIVSPCMRCGATGLRPTFGRVSRSGAMALCWSYDKVGPITRRAEDAIIVLRAIHGAHEGDPASVSRPLQFDARAPVRGMRLGYDRAWLESDMVTDADRRAFEVARELGLQLVERSLPELPYDSLSLEILVESAAAFEELTLSGRDEELRWQEPVAWPNTFRLARFISAVDLVQVQRMRRQVMDIMDEVFSDVDLMMSPTHVGPLLLVTNATGHPALTLRAGMLDIDLPRDRWNAPPRLSDATGETPRRRVPHGVTLWGKPFEEGSLTRVGMALESGLGVADERPDLDNLV